MTRRLIIVGGGAGGVLVALHVVRNSRESTTLTIIEPQQRLGEGVAYSTQDDTHLLNVPAGGMSAYSDDPQHFAAWAGCAPDAFVARHRYAAYLRSELASAVAASNTVHMQHVCDAAITISHDPLRVTVSNGTVIDGDALILALGNAPPTPPDWVHDFTATRVVSDPWAPRALDAISAGRQVLCIGTGLTFVDVALSLARRGVRVTGVSRHGLLPMAHASFGALPVLPASFATPRAVLRWIRTQADWRAALGALRPATPHIWQGFTPRQQAQFLRLARRYWDIHRHRMSTEVAHEFAHRQATGAIVVRRGDGRQLAESGTFDAVVLCTGPDDAALLTTPPLRALVDAGVICPGPHGMGVNTDAVGGQITSAAGSPAAGLFAIGPLRRGTLGESTAGPEIRSQAQQLARLLVS
jgi:uncharacterized NAD(P)/FAD-binding protein YdhS